MPRKPSTRSPVTIGFAVALLSGLALSSPARSAASGVYGMTGFSSTRMHPTISETGLPVNGSASRATGIRLGVGYQRDANLAYECTLGSLGRTEAQSGGAKAAWAVTAYGCGVLLVEQYDPRTSWFLKAAMQKVSLRMEASAPGGNVEVRDWSTAFGVGAKFDFSKAAGWRFEYERVFDVGDAGRTGKFTLGTLLVSLYYGF